MKKIFMGFVIILIYFILCFLQVNFFSWFTIAGVSPNLLILFVLFIGIFTNEKIGAGLGFFIGLYTDFLFSNTIGITAIFFASAGYFGKFLNNRFSEKSKITMVIMGTVITAIYEICINIYKFFILSSKFSIFSFLLILGVELVYNALLIIIFYPIIHKLGVKAMVICDNKKALPKYF